MNKNSDVLEEKKLSDVIFSLLPENNIITNRAFLYAFKGNFLKASMLSRYTHCFLKNNNQEIIYKDKTFEEQYYCPEISVKRAKKELKDEGFITVVQKGIPALGYIAVNIEKVAEILGNFKRYQIDTTGSINLIPHIYNNKNNNNKNNNILSDFGQNEYRNIDLCVNRRGVTHDRVGTSNLTPPPTSNLTPIITTNSNNLIKNIKKGQKGCQNTTHNPASGTPSSPNGDESQAYDLQFESFWNKIQYKAQKNKAYTQWKKATNNGKSQTAIKAIEEGYERYVSFLAKTKKLGFNQSHMLMSRFLNHKDQLWLEEWKTEEEQRQERNKEQQKQFFEAKQKEEQKQKEQQRNELEEEKKQHLIAITTRYREYWSEVIKQRFGIEVTDNSIKQHQSDNTDYWIYFEEWCKNRYIADTIGAITKKGMDYDVIEERFEERVKSKKQK